MDEHSSGIGAKERTQAVEKLRQALELVRQARTMVEHTADGKTIENLLTAEAAIQDSVYTFD